MLTLGSWLMKLASVTQSSLESVSYRSAKYSDVSNQMMK